MGSTTSGDELIAGDKNTTETTTMVLGTSRWYKELRTRVAFVGRTILLVTPPAQRPNAAFPSVMEIGRMVLPTGLQPSAAWVARVSAASVISPRAIAATIRGQALGGKASWDTAEQAISTIRPLHSTRIADGNSIPASASLASAGTGSCRKSMTQREHPVW